MQGSGVFTLLYPWFRRQFRRMFKKTMKQAVLAVYNCDMLLRDYGGEFDTPSVTVYNPSDFSPEEVRRPLRKRAVVSYLGNLGVGRHESLMDVAQALREVLPESKLDVYGKMPSEEVRCALEACPSIDYKGFVSYEDVTRIMKDSDILVHAENFSDFYRDDLKYAFSTKIADCLKSGIPFLYYAPCELASTQYLLENGLAFVATDKSELTQTVRSLVYDSEARERILKKAQAFAQKNHDSDTNGRIVADLIKRVVYEGIAD